MKLGKIRHAALASVLSIALVGSWAPMAEADETLPPEDSEVVAIEVEEPLSTPEAEESAPVEEAPTSTPVEETPTLEPSPSVAPSAEPRVELSPEPSAEPTTPKTTTSRMASTQSVTAAAACSVSIGSAAQKAYGAETYAWGNYANCGSTTLELQKLSGGVWSTFTTRSISGTGSYTISLLSATKSPGTHTLRAKIGSIYSATTKLERLGAVSAATAGSKPVGQTTYVWGTAPGAAGRTAWTEVYVDGRWSRSQTTTTSASGSYTIPLTYGASNPGTYSYRVAVQYTDGTVVHSATVTITRVAVPKPPTISTAGSARVGATANAWGTVPNAPYTTVWTEVYVNGAWSRSQSGKTDANGYYALPLTYGVNTVGTYRYRVAASVGGTVVRSAEVSFRRTPAVDSRCLTGRVLCASKTTNKMHWMINGKILETVDVRYGRPGLETREGAFQVFRKSRDHVSSIYGTAMPFSMFFSGGQAVHYSADFARRGWVGGSAGCINVRDYNTLERIYDQVRIGDKVVVYW